MPDLQAGERQRSVSDSDLIRDLEAFLARAAAADLEPDLGPGLFVRAAFHASSPTSWQELANGLRDLCSRALEADEATAVAFWRLLLELAALNARRIPGERPPWL